MTTMIKCAVALGLILAAAGAWAQAKDAKSAPAKAASVSQTLDGLLKMEEGEFVPAVEAMPEDKLGYAPTAGEFKTVRTFGQQAKHVAAANYLFFAAAAGEKPPVDTGGENGPDAVKTKADIVKFVKDSFAYGHKVINSISGDKWTAPGPAMFPGGPSNALGNVSLAESHVMDHYGQMVEYLRLNGIIPPASRPQPAKK